MISPYIQLFRSQLKLDILTSLLRGEKKLSTLREELGSSGSTIIHALTDLETLKLTEQAGRHYRLTPLGVIEAHLIEEASSTVEVLEKFRDFWLRHDITAIPSHLLRRIGALRDSTMIQDDSTELDRVHITFKQLLLSSRRVRGVSPIFHSDFIGAFQLLLSEGATVDLILSRGVLDKTLTLADTRQILNYIEKDRLRIFVADELRVALTVTENSFSMGFFSLNGEYDYSRDLVSNSRRAIEWGDELFQHFLKDAERLELVDLGLDDS
ncbi:MAG: winged helix-turn-helix domain-containing protein [Candidatus Bathyarchaeota archaeon]